MTTDDIRTSLDALDQLLKGINDHVNQVLAIPLISSLPVVGSIIQGIHDGVSSVSHTIEAISNVIQSGIGTLISDLVPGSVDFLTSVVSIFSQNVSSILGNLATAEEFVASAIGEIKKHSGDAAGFVLGALGAGISAGLVDAMKFLEGQDAQTVNGLLDEILKVPGAPPWFTAMTGGVRARGAEWQVLVLPFLVGAMLRPIGDALLDPWLKTVAYGVNQLSQTEMRSPSDLIEARLQNIIADQQFHAEMARNNFNPGTADQMLRARNQRLLPEEAIKLVWRGDSDLVGMQQELSEVGISPGRTALKMSAAIPLLSEDEIRQIFLRGIIDRPKHDALMLQHGYTQDRINQKVNLYYLIPGPQDLIHMGIRNVFDENIVKTFNLAGDAPDAFFRAAAQQGISQDWALKFWEAHWIVPGTDEAFRMYQRTLDAPVDPNADVITLLDGSKVYNIIGRPTLNLFLKDKDTPPYYRDKLTEIAYHPLNRIDIRRMRIIGSLTQAQVQRAYLDLGYNLKNATLLADFVEKLAAQTRKDKASPFVDTLRRRILQYYVDEKLELSDASFALTDLGFTVEEANHYLTEAALIQKADDAVQVEAGIGRIFVSGYITEDDARTRLGAANTPAKAIDRLIRKWNLQRELRQDTEHFHKMRDLTKSEVTEAYTDRLMSQADAETFLLQLGYPKNEADIVLSLADYKAARTTRTAMTEAIKAAYVNGALDLVPASNKLDALSLPTDRRDALLLEWTLLRETRTEKIPIATLRDLVRTSKMTRDNAFSHLKRHRYTDTDANIMLDLWQGK